MIYSKQRKILAIDNILTIQNEKVDIHKLETNIKYISHAKSNGYKEVLFKQKVGVNEQGEKEYVVVYTNDTEVAYVRCTEQQLYNRLVKVKNRLLHASITQKKVKLTILAYIVNDYGLEIEDQKFYINSEISQHLI